MQVLKNSLLWAKSVTCMGYFVVGLSNPFKALTIISLVLLSFSSCKKDRSGDVVFWYTESTAQSLQYGGVSSLTIYVDNEVIGTYSTNLYAAKIPECGSQGSVSVSKDLDKNKSKSFTYTVRDNFNNILWDGSINIESETCLNIELGL